MPAHGCSEQLPVRHRVESTPGASPNPKSFSPFPVMFAPRDPRRGDSGERLSSSICCGQGGLRELQVCPRCSTTLQPPRPHSQSCTGPLPALQWAQPARNLAELVTGQPEGKAQRQGCHCSAPRRGHPEHGTAARGAAGGVPGWEKGNQALLSRRSWAGGRGCTLLLVNTALTSCRGTG